eukprot:scaffold3275_cov35-Tisochrysis_lutea.AAC.3
MASLVHRSPLPLSASLLDLPGSPTRRHLAAAERRGETDDPPHLVLSKNELFLSGSASRGILQS